MGRLRSRDRRLMQGKTVPKNVDTGTALVTKANAGKFG
jgi:ABC-type sugar transport system substrate-binding protein